MRIFIKKIKYRLKPAQKLRRAKRARGKKWPNFWVISIMFIATGALLGGAISKRFAPIIREIAAAKVKAAAGRIINDAIISQVAQNESVFDGIETIERKESGEVSSVELNPLKMNALKAAVTREIQEKFSQIDAKEIYVPLGSALKNEMFAGRGPKIPVKIITLSTLEMNLLSEMVSCGINQSKHEIILRVKANICAILPAGKIETEATSQIPVSETIIIGDTPRFYGNICQPEIRRAN
jgi:sporulation protein YunB